MLLLVRSANDADHDVANYNARTHGYVSKMTLNPVSFLERIVPYWTLRFGIISTIDIAPRISEDFDEEISVFKRELAAFNDRYIKGKLPTNQEDLWKELHNLKGSAMGMVELVHESIKIVDLIGKMRNGNINAESLLKLSKLIKDF